MEQPYYRLRELIKTKYGEEKFHLGMQLVAKWVQYHTKEYTTGAHVLNVCNLRSDSYQLTAEQATALRQLFSLKRNEELYTFPEHTPEHLKTKP